MSNFLLVKNIILKLYDLSGPSQGLKIRGAGDTVVGIICPHGRVRSMVTGKPGT